MKKEIKNRKINNLYFSDGEGNQENRRENSSIHGSMAETRRVGADTALPGKDAASAETEHGAVAAPAETETRFEAAPAHTGNSVGAETAPSSSLFKKKFHSTLKKRAQGAAIVAKQYVLTALLPLSAWLIGYFGLSFAWIAIVLFLFLRRIRADEDKTRRRRKTTAPEEAPPAEEAAALNAGFRPRPSGLPSWMTFPDVESVDWMNEIAARVWPYVGRSVATLIRRKVEPKIRAKLANSRIAGFFFGDISLGDQAPTIGGVKVNILNPFFFLLLY